MQNTLFLGVFRGANVSKKVECLLPQMMATSHCTNL